MERREYRRLEKVIFTSDNELDLHYMDRQEAFQKLRSFIFDRCQNGVRDVMIITGKGRKSWEWGKPRGTLHNLLPGWLQHKDIKPHVIDFHCPAARHHGGEGACYVRLRRLAQGKSKG